MPTPIATVIAPYDHSPEEIESVEELDLHLAEKSLARLVVQGLDLTRTALSGIDVEGTLFVGCVLDTEQAVDVVRRGAMVVPAFPRMPYATQPSRLYTADDLIRGFAEAGFDGMHDTVVYRHYVGAGGAMPDLREALAQRVHDHGIENALSALLTGWTESCGPDTAVGIMGGHAELRGSHWYRDAARLTRLLARAGRLVVTGGGPGVMEAANLGAYASTTDADALGAAIDRLAAAPDYHDGDGYVRAALEVREKLAADSDNHWAGRGGLSIPTWFFGHEPTNLFAAAIGKLFSNAIREELILKLSRGGIVFAPGRAGTVQEVFQAATMTYYRTAGDSGPYIFLGRRFWTEELPVRSLLGPLLNMSPQDGVGDLIHITDDVDEAFELLTAQS